MPSLSGAANTSEQQPYYDKIYKSKATPEAKGVGGSSSGTGVGIGRYATSPSSTGGIGITRRLSSAFANTTASAGQPSLQGSGTGPSSTGGILTTAETGSTMAMNAPSTNGSAHSLSVASGNAPTTTSTPSKTSAESRAFLRSESRAYANHSSASDTLARIQFLLRTNAKVVGAILVFAFFVVFVLDDDGSGAGSLRGNL